MSDRSNLDPSADDHAGTEDHARTGFLRRSLLDPVVLLLTALTVPLAVWGVLRTAADPEDTGMLTSALLAATAILPTAWSVIRVLWGEDARSAIFVAMQRTVVVPLFVAWPSAIAVAITVHLPAVRDQIRATQDDYGWRYFFGESDLTLLQEALLLTGLVGLFIAMIVALALCVFIVLPVLAWLKPVATAESNMLLVDTPADRAAAKSSIRMLSVLLMMVFAVPTLIVVGAKVARAHTWIEAFTNIPRFFAEPQYYFGDALWVLGIVSIPVGVFVILWLRRIQRPDIAARAQAGVNSFEDDRRWRAGGKPRSTRPRRGSGAGHGS